MSEEGYAGVLQQQLDDWPMVVGLLSSTLLEEVQVASAEGKKGGCRHIEKALHPRYSVLNHRDMK